MRELAAQGEVIERNLWTGITQVRPGAGIAVVGTPEQCADLVTFLASERASHIAGTVVTIDGGAAHYSGVL